MKIKVGNYIADWPTKFPKFEHREPWHVGQILSECLPSILQSDDIFVDPSAVVETGAILKGPCWIGPGCFVAASAYLRGGIWLDRNCTIGPACELKTTMMFEGSKAAHLNFVGDSIIGSHVNIEAGAIIANYRNEFADKQIRIVNNGSVVKTAVDKFGALIGDGVRIGANAVIAPGAFIDPAMQVQRLALIDQSPVETD